MKKKLKPTNARIFASLRTFQKLTQEEVGQLVGKDKSFICRLEKGTRRIKKEEAIILSRALNVPMEVLFHEN